MSEDAKRALEWAGVLAVVLLVVFGLAWVLQAKCEARWERSGMKVDWALIQGCVVQRKDGTWIPADNFREVAP